MKRRRRIRRRPRPLTTEEIDRCFTDAPSIINEVREQLHPAAGPLQVARLR